MSEEGTVRQRTMRLALHCHVAGSDPVIVERGAWGSALPSFYLKGWEFAMADSTIDYAAVLEDLKARRATFDAAIAAVEIIVASGGGSAAPAAGGRGEGTEVQRDSFFGMTINDAAVKYLGMQKRTQTAAQITEALVAGGYTFSTGNPLNTVGAILNRVSARPTGEIVNLGRNTFGLASWYPGRPRKKKANGDDKAAGTSEMDAAAASTPSPSPSSTEPAQP